MRRGIFYLAVLYIFMLFGCADRNSTSHADYIKSLAKQCVLQDCPLAMTNAARSHFTNYSQVELCAEGLRKVQETLIKGKNRGLQTDHIFNCKTQGLVFEVRVSFLSGGPTCADAYYLSQRADEFRNSYIAGTLTKPNDYSVCSPDGSEVDREQILATKNFK